MKSFHIPPFHFPTTTLFVDDNTDFLHNLTLQLDPQLACQVFDSPITALKILNATSDRETLVDHLFSPCRKTEQVPLSHQLIDLNLDKVHREVYNEHRFEHVSVAVVDYDMPAIDGLEFCRSIQNPAIKKVLLTGKADEKIAVRAFNQGLIDRFVPKQGNDVMGTLRGVIRDLQHSYFMHSERMLSDALALGRHSFLRDAMFAEKFAELCGELHIVEFYLCSEPDGMLMLDADGTATLMVVSSEERLRDQYEIACDRGAPQELLDILKSGEVVPYFWKTGGHYHADFPWRPCLYPAMELKGEQWHYYALVGNPPPFRAEFVVSYNTFLGMLDVRKQG